MICWRGTANASSFETSSRAASNQYPAAIGGPLNR
jgi:hypothetical protein